MAQSTERKIDLDGNPVNGAESRVVTRVVSTFPVQVENTVYNNTPGISYSYIWDGAGPGGFDSTITAGPNVGTRWVWSSTSVVYTIESPIVFIPTNSVPVFGQPKGGMVSMGGGNGTFIVPGKSIVPTQVTLSNASLTSSLITFFSPADTKARCGVECVTGQCDMFVENLSGGAATIRGEQQDCCPQPHQIICGGECFSYLEDPQNCGGCGIACNEGEVCSDGECVCPAGETECADQCVNTAADPLNCGGCGTTCLTEQSCSTGACVCPGGETTCGAACVDTGSDPANCGTCGTTCLSEQSCSSGACVCPDGETTCGAICANLGTDVSNCGACGSTCLSEQSCSAGACVCPDGETTCGAICADLGSDESNCGACGATCAGDQFCYQGLCFCLGEGLSNCSGACVATATDPANCGACGNVCSATQNCVAGSCVEVCPAGQTLCGGLCVNLQTDESNCGTCGNTCRSGWVCEQGSCSKPPDDDEHGLTSRSYSVLPEAHGHRVVTADTGVAAVAAPKPMAIRRGATEGAARETASRGTTRDRAPIARERGEASGTAVDSTSTPKTDAPHRSAALSAVEEAPVCDIAPFEQVVGDGESFVLSQPSARYGKEVYTTVSIETNGNLVAQGPCPVIVPVTNADTTGVVLSPVKVSTVDSTGDGLCQPQEGFCNYFIGLNNVGDTPCLNPVATLSSAPDAVNTSEVVFLNDTSTYTSWPGWPGGGQPLATQTNLTAFSIATPDEQANVGRGFQLSVHCANVPDDIVTPVVLGIGGRCNPATDVDGDAYDVVDGFQTPLSAQLVLEGGPVNYSSKKFGRGTSVPLKVALGCGALTLSDEQIEPNPEIVAIIHDTLGSLPLENINGQDNANPDDPKFKCSSGGGSNSCQYQLRTDDLPLGTYVIGIRMPDARVFQAGFTLRR